MENATKALLIAGGVLLAIIIISAGLALYITFSRGLKDYSSQPEMADLQQINARFEKYRGRNDITAQDIITIYNYVKENQNKIPYSISVKVNNMELNFESYEKELKYIQENQEKKFVCDRRLGIEYNSQGQVISINFNN